MLWAIAADNGDGFSLFQLQFPFNIQSMFLMDAYKFIYNPFHITLRCK